MNNIQYFTVTVDKNFDKNALLLRESCIQDKRKKIKKQDP